MSFPDFYEQEDSSAVLKEYEEIKITLEQLNGEWEVLAEKVE